METSSYGGEPSPTSRGAPREGFGLSAIDVDADVSDQQSILKIDLIDIFLGRIHRFTKTVQIVLVS
jgi:hypothetical protein